MLLLSSILSFKCDLLCKICLPVSERILNLYVYFNDTLYLIKSQYNFKWDNILRAGHVWERIGFMLNFANGQIFVLNFS